MACLCHSYHTEEERRSHAIDKNLVKEGMRATRQVKVLLLGAGETGKSTFAKQMRIIYGKDYERKDLVEFRETIYHNLFKAMKVLVDARGKLGIPWENRSNEWIAEMLVEWKIPKLLEQEAFLSKIDLVACLWNDHAIQEAFRRRNEYQLPDSTKYFMERIPVIRELDYLPTREDVLRSRKISRGITEYHTEVARVPFMFVDVGGQRHYRQKWIICFENVTTVLFFVSASEYDEVLAEDRHTNRLRESIDLFKDVANSVWFAASHIILFFNKMDQLREKIHVSDIKRYFPAFRGNATDETDVKNFLYGMFESKRKDHSRTLFHHFTTAIDTNNIKFVFAAVKEIILQRNLEQHILL